MDKKPLWLYVVGILIALALVNYISWVTGGAVKLRATELVSMGFLLGMFAMYIAVHLYSWK